MAEIFNEGQTGDAHPMLDKIRKLLAKANANGVTDAEAELFTAKAAALAAKYGIDQAVAAGSAIDGEEMVLKEYEVCEAYAKMHATLLYRIAESLRCKSLMTSEGVTVIGYLSDIERAELLYTSISLQMASGAVRVATGRRQAWMQGFILAIQERLEAAEAKARDDSDRESGGTGTSVVLASRELAVRNAFRAEFPHTTHGRRVHADMAGYAAGQRANLGGTSVGTGGRAALAS